MRQVVKTLRQNSRIFENSLEMKMWVNGASNQKEHDMRKVSETQD